MRLVRPAEIADDGFQGELAWTFDGEELTAVLTMRPDGRVPPRGLVIGPSGDNGDLWTRALRDFSLETARLLIRESVEDQYRQAAGAALPSAPRGRSDLALLAHRQQAWMHSVGRLARGVRHRPKRSSPRPSS